MKLDFKQLPGFAKFILNEHLEEFVKEQLRLSRQLNVPLLKYFESMSDGQLIEMSKITTAELLTYLAENNAKQQIEDSLKKWKSDQLPLISKEQVVGEDITLISYIRKQAVLKFLPLYTSDTSQIIELVSELDKYILESESGLFKIFIDLQQEKINEHLHFIEKVTHTSPSIIYVFDEIEQKEIYSNKRSEEFLGYTNEELQQMGDSIMASLIHPDDVELILENSKNFHTILDGEIRSIEYRIKDKNNNYRWMRAYESVFKRKEDGIIWQKIGTAIDIHNEKIIAEQLMHREHQLLDALELAEMGSFEWDFITHEMTVTPQLKKILELQELGNMKGFMENVHPTDRIKVQKAIESAIKENNVYECEYRYQAGEKAKVIWSRGIIYKENGKLIMRGTIIDVTERHHMIQRLQRSDELHKQAQSITHLGNYTWDLNTNELKWSDELYRIYEFDPGEKVNYEKVFAQNHLEDIQIVRDSIQHSIETLEPFNFNYRIVLKSGANKILLARGEILADENGKPYKIVGTAQDVTEKQRLIEKLQRSEDLYKQSDELYKQAQAIAHIGNWTWNVGENKVVWTDEVYRIYGLEPQSKVISYEHYLSLIHPEDKEMVIKYVEDCMKLHNAYEFYHRIVTADEKTKVVHSIGEVVLNEQDEPMQLIGTVQDVTSQKKTEQRLRDNQNFIQKIADATPSIIASYNINTGKYTFINKGLEKLLGYDPKRVLDEGISFFIDLIHPDDMASIMGQNEKALNIANDPERCEADIITEFQYRMRHINGQYRWFHTYGTIFDRNQQGKVEHVLNISLDITDTIEAEKKVKEQQHFITHIADASPTVLYLFEAKDGRVQYINKEVKGILGYTPEEIIDMGANVIPNLYHPEDALKISERLHEYKHAVKPKTLFEFECRMKHKNGEWRWLLVREIIFKHNDDGRITEILGAALDITDRKKMEYSLFQKTVELEQSNASLEEFAYVASHDLKEPLRKISTFGDRLASAQEETLNNDGKLYLRRIIESSRRMQQLIDDLLSVSMIASEKSFEPYSLQTILEEVMQNLEFKIEEKHAIINSKKLPEANIIPSQFRQLFQNLVSNSLKFSKDGIITEITISYDYLKPTEVLQYHNLGQANRYLKLCFSDNGIGFDQQFADKIFTIFQRLHNKNEYEGTGIGLAICKKIVENHGGFIYATSAQNMGSDFTIIIPV